MNAEMRKVRVSPVLFDEAFARAADGRRLSCDWGERDDEDFYTPTFTATFDGTVVITGDEHARLLGVQDIARLIVSGWRDGYPVGDGSSESELIDRLEDALR